MSNPTDTNQSSELFELCKEVYEKTGWDDTQNGYYFVDGEQPLLYDKDNFHISKEPWWGNMAYLSPAYTSDYLLEKLPEWTELKKKTTISYTAKIDALVSYSFESDTPLKSLLKLTIALSEAGELK